MAEKRIGVPATLILDIGKTHIKCVVLNEQGQALWSRQQENVVVDGDPWPHFDHDGIWRFFVDSCAEVSSQFTIGNINVSTHGATAVLLDASGELIAPIADYEYDSFDRFDTGYASIRPAFAQTLSPALPAGLNLGRQIHWLQQAQPQTFARLAHVLMYPQYWTWRMTGVMAGEVTSLGCHTDLWNPAAGDYSSLAHAMGIRQCFPDLVAAHQPLSRIDQTFAAETGLPSDCVVYPGVHDSNASFARHLHAGLSKPFTVVTTGTWFIAMAAGAPLTELRESLDTLANVDVTGTPLACARFMGGREFAAICAASDSDADADADAEVSLGRCAELIEQGVYAWPAFSSGGGPFIGQQGHIDGNTSYGTALATLYLALMVDLELELVQSSGDVVVGSIAQKNPVLCALLAQLRPQQTIKFSGDDAGTVAGAWSLTRWGSPDQLPSNYQPIAPAVLAGLEGYRGHWRQQLNSHLNKAS